MLSSLFHLSVSIPELILRALLVYGAVLFLLRITGKRQLGQMSATEFVALLLISNAVQNSMNGGDNSLVAGLILAAVLMLMSWLISVLIFRHHGLRAIIEGTPSLLVNKGVPIERHLKAEQITLDELKVLLRKQGIHHLREVRTAILEADGTLTVTRVDEDHKVLHP